MAGRRRKKAKVRDYVLQVTEAPGEEVLLTLAGRLNLDNARPLEEEVQKLWSRGRPGRLTVNLAGVEYLDSAGALVLVGFMNQAQERGVAFQLVEVPDKVQGILDLIDPASLTRPPLRPAPHPAEFFTQLSQGLVNIGKDLFELVVFLGELLFALGRSFQKPREIRWAEVFVTMKRAGMDGVPILGLMSLLMGMVIAFMSSLQLKQLGATIYVASLVGIAMVKELGPLLTAILVSGRSGSAFAAEIGTMKVNEEVDALVVMGFEPLGFLAVPKVLAAAVVVPILTVYATFFGILGGLLVGVSLLDMTLYTYTNETYYSLDTFNMSTSLLKAVVFGVVVAGIGCQRGFKVSGGAEGVGLQTTSAVVASLFLIIIIDAAFAIVLHYVR